MTSVRIHGILAREYGDSFILNINNPKDVLQAIDCNRTGFIRRIINLQKEGFHYDIIIDKKSITKGEEMEAFRKPKNIDLVPVIAGSGPAAAIIQKILLAVIFAGITYALTPKPEVEALEVEARGNTQSLVFSNRVNLASQGAPVPVGYGRLLVGTQVIQATIKSYPQYADPQYLLTDGIEINNTATVNTDTESRTEFADGNGGDGGANYAL
jgi:predicted phage tail protein